MSLLPAELFRLENLTVLSLRGNELIDIPPAIAKLQNLEELNIAGNHVKCLPWELMDLFDRSQDWGRINVRPNPLLEPTNLDGPSPLLKFCSERDLLQTTPWTNEHYEALKECLAPHLKQTSQPQRPIMDEHLQLTRSQIQDYIVDVL